MRLLNPSFLDGIASSYFIQPVPQKYSTQLDADFTQLLHPTGGVAQDWKQVGLDLNRASKRVIGGLKQEQKPRATRLLSRYESETA